MTIIISTTEARSIAPSLSHDCQLEFSSNAHIPKVAQLNIVCGQCASFEVSLEIAPGRLLMLRALSTLQM